MKSMPKQNESEFRRRLSNYSEEPDRDLWPKISSRLAQVPPRWAVWARRLSALIIAVSPLFIGAEIAGVQDTSIVEKPVTAGPTQSAMSLDQLCGEDQAVARRGVTLLRGDSSRLAAPRFPGIARAPSLLDTEMPTRTVRFFQYAKRPKGFDIVQMDVIQRLDAVMKQAAVKELASEPQKKKKKQGLFLASNDLYVTVMPTLGYQRIKSNTSDNILIQEIKPIPVFSKDRLGIRLEVGLQSTGSKRWRAFGGILYFQRDQTFSYVERRVDSLISVPGKGGTATLEPKFSLVPGTIDYDVKNIGLHFGLSYRVWDKNSTYVESEVAYSSANPALRLRKRFLHEIGGGIELHKSLKSTDAISVAEGLTDPSLYAFINLFYRMQYPRTGRLRAILQPTLNYSFYISKDVNVPFYVKPYGFGLNLGCRYHL